MELKKAKELIETTMRDSGLKVSQNGVKSWKCRIVSFDKYGPTNSLAFCRRYSVVPKIIFFDEHFAETADESQIKLVALHEIAHALTRLQKSKNGKRIGHGRLWRRKAQSLGVPKELCNRRGQDLKELKESILENKKLEEEIEQLLTSS